MNKKVDHGYRLGKWVFRVSVPVYQDVEDYQGDDWKEDIEEGVHPQEVDGEVPVVISHVPAS